MRRGCSSNEALHTAKSPRLSAISEATSGTLIFHPPQASSARTTARPRMIFISYCRDRTPCRVGSHSNRVSGTGGLRFRETAFLRTETQVQIDAIQQLLRRLRDQVPAQSPA